MSELRLTLVSDGSSDRALLPILRWLLINGGVNLGIRETWADFRSLRYPPRGLSRRIIRGVELFPCDVLFVHRDAETESPKSRRKEIEDALDAAFRDSCSALPAVCVVPVRMTEAWLLSDGSAIR